MSSHIFFSSTKQDIQGDTTLVVCFSFSSNTPPANTISKYVIITLIVIKKGFKMAKEYSFDISAKINMQSFKDAINLVDREVSNRYDFKGTPYEVSYKEKDKLLVLVASSDNKLDALKDVVVAKLLKQGLSSKVLDETKVEDASGGTRKATFKIVDYIESKEAKKITAEIKNLKLKVNAQIEGDSIRVKGAKLDDLQAVIAAIRSMEWEAPLVFENMR